MSLPALLTARVQAMTADAIAKVRALEAASLACPQVEIGTHHVIHAGVYARTIRIPAGVVLTGAEIKRSTLLIINGHVSVAVGDGVVEMDGFNVIPASAGRKQAFVAHSDTEVTMVFATGAQSVAECEDEFTDEAHRLMSRTGENTVVITGE